MYITNQSTARPMRGGEERDKVHTVPSTNYTLSNALAYDRLASPRLLDTGSLIAAAANSYESLKYGSKCSVGRL